MNRNTWIIIIVAVITIIGLIWIFNRGVPDINVPDPVRGYFETKHSQYSQCMARYDDRDFCLAALP